MKILKWLDENAEEFLLLIFLVIMVLTMGVQVLMRYLLNYSLTWSEELTRYLFVWSAFISIGYCTKHRSSIKLEQMLTYLPNTLAQIIRLISKVVMFVFFIYVLQSAVAVVQTTYASGQVSSALGLPVYLVQLSTVVGFALAIVRIIQSFMQCFVELLNMRKQHS
jgi:TRAP-type C4-dicarboxylate transport system permease small subunit